MHWVCWGRDFIIKLYLYSPFRVLGLRSKGQELAITPGGQKVTECDMELAARGFWELRAACLPSFLTILTRTAVPSASYSSQGLCAKEGLI